MSDRMWEGTIGHARTCPAGDRVYVHHRSHFIIFLNSICEVRAVAINGASLVPPEELTRVQKVSFQYNMQMLLKSSASLWLCYLSSYQKLFTGLRAGDGPRGIPKLGTTGRNKWQWNAIQQSVTSKYLHQTRAFFLLH